MMIKYYPVVYITVKTMPEISCLRIDQVSETLQVIHYNHPKTTYIKPKILLQTFHGKLRSNHWFRTLRENAAI